LLSFTHFPTGFHTDNFQGCFNEISYRKNVENMFLDCGLFLFCSPHPYIICRSWLSLGLCPSITAFLYIEVLTSYFNMLVERAVLVTLQVCSSSASKVVQKSSSQLSGRWLLHLEGASSAGGLTWDLELFNLLLRIWNSWAVSWFLEGKQIPRLS